MVKTNSKNGLNLVDRTQPQNLCNGCILGKMHKSPFPKEGTRASNVGDLVHSLVCGPMETISPGKALYYVLFKDDFSGWCVGVVFMQQKSEVFTHFKQLVAAFKTQHNYTVRTLRSDNRGEI